MNERKKENQPTLRERAEKIVDDIALKANHPVEVDDSGRKWPQMNLWLGGGQAPFFEGETVLVPDTTDLVSRAKGVYRRLAKIEYENIPKYKRKKSGKLSLENYYTANPADEDDAVRKSYDAAFEKYWARPMREAAANNPQLARELARVFMDRMDDQLFNSLDDRRAEIRDVLKQELKKMQLPDQAVVISERAEDEAVAQAFFQECDIAPKVTFIHAGEQREKGVGPKVISSLRSRLRPLARTQGARDGKFFIGLARGSFTLEPIQEDRIITVMEVGTVPSSVGLSRHRAMWKDNPANPPGFDPSDPKFVAEQTSIALENAFFDFIKKNAPERLR